MKVICTSPITKGAIVAHALLRAASALLPTLGEPGGKKCREVSRHGTQSACATSNWRVYFLTSACLCLSAGLFGAVDGSVKNATSGKPQPNVLIQMVQPGQGGMQTLGTTKSGPDGTFKFERDARGPRLLHAIYQGVMYTKMIAPDAPSNAVAITVYDVTSDAAVVKHSQHVYILQPTSDGLGVEEVVFLANGSSKTYNDPKGTFRFYLPDNATGKATVSLTSPEGMVPVQRQPEKTSQPNVYSVSYALKPGETKVAISYAVQAGAERAFQGRILQAGEGNRLVLPIGITAEGSNIKLVGQDPQNKANIYDITGREFAVVLKGTAAASSGAADPNEDPGMPQIETTKPRIYDRLLYVLGLSLGILAIGFVLMYRAAPRKVSPPK